MSDIDDVKEEIFRMFLQYKPGEDEKGKHNLTIPRYRLQKLNPEQIYHASLRTNTRRWPIQFRESIVEEMLV